MKRTILVLLLIFSLFLSACASNPPAVVASATPAPTNTPLTTATNTPVPTATSTPTETPLPPTPTPIPETLKIGLLAPLSFENPMLSVSPVEGARLAIDEWNETADVLGRKIELVMLDTQCNPDLANEAFNQFVDEGIDYIIGDLCSGSTIELSRLAEENGVVLITPGATRPRVTVSESGDVRPFTFRACVADPYQGTMLAKFAFEEGNTTAFLLYQAENDYTQEIADTFEQKFAELGGEVVGSEQYTTGQQSFTTALKKVRDSRAEVLVVPGYYEDVNLIASQVHQMGIKVILMGADGWDSPELDMEALEGGFFTTHHSPADTRTIVQEWNKRYGAVYSDDQGQPKIPDMIATLSYDAMNMLLAAIQQTGEDDPALVSDALASGSWSLVTGETRFDDYHDPIKPLTIMSIQNGQVTFFTMVDP